MVMALQIHAIVQDAQDLNLAIDARTINEEMPSTASLPRNVQDAQSWKDIVASPRSSRLGTG
jgi:hypothetical protein